MVSLEKKMLDIKKMFETSDNELLQTRSALEHKRTEENNIKKELEHLNENIRKLSKNTYYCTPYFIQSILKRSNC